MFGLEELVDKYTKVALERTNRFEEKLDQVIKLLKEIKEQGNTPKRRDGNG